MDKKTPTSPRRKSIQKQSWSTFLESLQREWKKVAWIAGVIIAVFKGGISTGRFYESLMNKFTLSEMKTDHAREMQDVKTEFILREMNSISEGQKKMDKSILNNLDTLKDEK